jgi:hypothetical protein
MRQAASRRTCRADEGSDQVFVEEQIVAIDEQFFIAGRNLFERIDFQRATAVGREQVALQHPERLVQHPQVARRLAERGDERALTDNNAFHRCDLPATMAGDHGVDEPPSGLCPCTIQNREASLQGHEITVELRAGKSWKRAKTRR